MITLYRKYRPQNFTEVVGQNHIKITLEHEISSGKIAHAYLFCGPRAVGKTTLARVFSKAINCLDRKEGSHEPCNKCENCNDINSARAVDIIEIDAASHTGVDNVRENIITSARVSPVKAKYKVFIIDEVHMLSVSAFNALLKILEEPPKNVVFILCTTETHKVPATIISRCQRFDFKRIGVTDVVKKLAYIANEEKIIIDRSILEAIARNADGHMRDAESLLGQVVSIGGKEITREEADLVIPRSDMDEVINFINLIGNKDAAGGIRLINRMVDDGVDLKTFLNDVIEIFRKILLIKISPAIAEKVSFEFGEDMELKISEAGKNFTPVKLIKAAEKFAEAKNKIKISSISQFPIEIAIIELCLISETVAPVIVSTAGTKSAAPAKAEPAKPAIATSIGNINHSVIMEKWNEVLNRVKTENHSLSFVLKVCEPKGLEGNKLCLAFKYKFHKDRISDNNIKLLVEKILKEVYGAEIEIEAVVDEELEMTQKEAPQVGSPDIDKKENIPDNKDDQSMIDNLLKTFGGKVVG